MDRSLVSLSIALVCLQVSLAASEKDLLVDIRDGQKKMMEQIEQLKVTVTKVQLEQHGMMKQIKEIKTNSVRRDRKLQKSLPTIDKEHKVRNQLSKKLLHKLSAGMKSKHAAILLPSDSSTANMRTTTSLPVGRLVTAGFTAASGNTTIKLGNTTPSWRRTTVQKGDKGSSHKAGFVYLVMAKGKKLILHKMEGAATIHRTIPFEVSTLVHDIHAHSLIWFDKKTQTGGRFDKAFNQKTLWHFPTSKTGFDSVTIDNENQVIYLFNHHELQTINLKSGHVKRTRIHLWFHNRKDIVPWINPKKRTFLISATRGRDTLIYEISQKHFQIRHITPGPQELKTSVFVPEREAFIYCDRGNNLFFFFIYARQSSKTSLRCPPKVVRLLHYNGFVWAISKTGVYSAKLGTEGALKATGISGAMVSAVAEIILK